MDNIGFFIGDKLITKLPNRLIPIPEMEKSSFPLRNSGDFELYMKRKGKYYLRDKFGRKITFECKPSPELEDVKMHTELNVKWGGSPK